VVTAQAMEAADPQPVLPDPEVQPTVPVWPTVAKAVGISRQAAYDAVARGEIESIRVGDRVLVLTAPLRRKLGLDLDRGEGHAA